MVNFRLTTYNLRKQVKYAEIDRELFELLQSDDTRARLRVLLVFTYLQDAHVQKRDILPLIITIGTTILPLAS